MKKTIANATVAALSCALAAALSIATTAPMAFADEWECEPEDQFEDIDDAGYGYNIPDPVFDYDLIDEPSEPEFDDIDYDYVYDFSNGAYDGSFFDLSPYTNFTLNYLYGPSGTYVMPQEVATYIAQRICRVSNRSLYSSSAELFVSDDHGLCWSVELRQQNRYGYQRVFFVTIDAVTGRAYSAKVIR